MKVCEKVVNEAKKQIRSNIQKIWMNLACQLIKLDF